MRDKIVTKAPEDKAPSKDFRSKADKFELDINQFLKERGIHQYVCFLSTLENGIDRNLIYNSGMPYHEVLAYNLHCLSNYVYGTAQEGRMSKSVSRHFLVTTIQCMSEVLLEIDRSNTKVNDALEKIQILAQEIHDNI